MKDLVVVPMLVILLGVTLVGCGASEVTATPVPSLTASPPPAPTATGTSAPTPTETPTPPPPPTPVPPTETPAPSPTPPAAWLPDDSLALYAAGAETDLQLFALHADNSYSPMELEVYPGATASASGRWLASPVGQIPAETVRVVDFQSEESFSLTAAADFQVFRMIFDPSETRLVWVEVGPPGENIAWALVSVDLADRSVARFEETIDSETAMRPGFPLGWSPTGDRLYLNTFWPYSEGYAGVWEVTLPPGADPVALDSFERRLLLEGNAYSFHQPRLSPDATQLLYLARDPDYVPEGYEPIAYDLAVNQLWSLDVASGESSLLLEVNDGSALGYQVAWSPDGSQIMFAQGWYQDDDFDSLTLKLRDGSGQVRDVAPLPWGTGWWWRDLEWDLLDVALLTLGSQEERTDRLYTVSLAAEAIQLAHSAGRIDLLGSPSPPYAVTVAERRLSQELEIPPEQIERVSFEHVQWRDGCLELPQPDEACTLAIVPGWRVLLRVDESLYEAHTDEMGNQVRWKEWER